MPPSRKPGSPPRQPVRRITPLEALLQHLKIPPDLGWDYLLIGDGSATTWDKTCGFASVIVERVTLHGEICDGAFCRGTNNVAEIMAVLYPLLYLMDKQDRQRQPNGATIVHVVTDNQNVAQIGEGLREPKSHRLLWSQLYFLRSVGILTHFHWIDRELSPIQRLAHHAANQVRILAEQGQAACRTETLRRMRVPDLAVFLDPDAVLPSPRGQD